MSDTPAAPKPPRRAGLIGPLFGWELIRLARRGQDARGRFILAASLLFVLTAFTQLWFWGVSPADVFFGTSQSLTIEESAKFGRSFALTFVVAQLGVMILLTPAYAAGGISDEKERQTLTYLLVSDLTAREILMGKFAGRLVFLLGILFAGLPILALTTLYGGVSIEFLLLGYVLTAATVTMYAAISAAAAMVSDTFRGALLRSYGLAAIHVFVGCGIPYFSPFSVIGIVFLSGDNLLYSAGVGLGYSAAELLVAGGAILLGIHWTRRLRSRPRDRRDDRTLTRHEQRRAIRKPLHDAEGRPIARRVAAPPEVEPAAEDATPRTLTSAARHAPAPRMRQRRRPPPVRTPTPHAVSRRPRIGDGDPFTWKERFTTGQKYTPDDESIHGILTGLGIAAACLIGIFSSGAGLGLVLDGFGDRSRAFATGFCLLTGSGGFFVYLVVLGVGATATVVRERQRNTLESLLAIPVDRRTILLPKARAVARRARWWGVATGLMIPLGFVFSKAPTVALPMIAFVAASAPAVLAYGVFLSVRCRTSTKAALWMLPAAAGVVLVPLGMWVNLDDRRWEMWTLVAFVLFVAVAPLGLLFWRQAVSDFEREGRA